MCQKRFQAKAGHMMDGGRIHKCGKCFRAEASLTDNRMDRGQIQTCDERFRAEASPADHMVDGSPIHKVWQAFSGRGDLS